MKNCNKYESHRSPEGLKTLFLGLFFFWAFSPQSAFAQCNNDVTPPTPLCKTTVSRDVLSSGSIIVTAQEFDAGSTDDCSPTAALSFFIETGPPSANPPSSTSLQFTGSQAGTHSIVLWVVDTSGNAAYCTAPLQISLCTQNLACNDQITIQLDANNMGTLSPSDGLEGGPYCSFHSQVIRLDPLSGGAPAAPSIALNASHIGTHMYQVTLLPIQNSCWGNVTIVGDPCVDDLTPPVAVCDEYALVLLDTSVGPTVLLTPQVLDDGSYDNCTAFADLDFRVERLSDYTGTPPADTSLDLGFADLGTQNIVLWVGDEAGNWNSCIVEVTLSLPAQHRIEGRVYADGNADCEYQSASETGLAGWQVLATGLHTGQQYVAMTDAQGQYQMLVELLETEFEVTLNAPGNYGGACGTTDTLIFPDPALSVTEILDIPVLLDDECPLLFVDLATPKIRPCFPGVYYVQYANASASIITGTYVDVTLDPALAFQGSTLPATDLGNQKYRFDTGDLDPGESGQFSINFNVDCAAPLGATHCTEAHIFPDTICPPMAGWSGANIVVEGSCANDSIFLKIKNTGTAPTAQSLNFIVVEDVLMRESGNFNLGIGATLELDPIIGNGATFRLEAQQEPGHPYGGMPAVAVEGCAGFTPGMVTLFPLNDPNPFIAVDCRENTSSFDPNDKQALPRGYATEHFIEKNTALDYTIRFQNTGTDTAFQVVVLDTLSDKLAASLVRPGASSHSYRFELLDGHILRFTFDNILLPDSNVNQAGSQGFVQFRVPQTPDNADGTRIENTAAIYFDFNAPVLTNQVFHTVGNHFILVSTDDAPGTITPLRVYPNPAVDRLVFDAKNWSGGLVHFALTDAQGSLVRVLDATSLPLKLERGQLPAGVYFFRMVDLRGGLLWSGKVLIR